MTKTSTIRNSRGSLGDLKSFYEESLSQLQDIFPEWSQDDLVTVLSDLGGDVELAVNRISEGHVMPWSETGKKPVVKKDIHISHSHVYRRPSNFLESNTSTVPSTKAASISTSSNPATLHVEEIKPRRQPSSNGNNKSLKKDIHPRKSIVKEESIIELVTEVEILSRDSPEEPIKEIGTPTPIVPVTDSRKSEQNDDMVPVNKLVKRYTSIRTSKKIQGAEIKVNSDKIVESHQAESEKSGSSLSSHDESMSNLVLAIVDESQTPTAAEVVQNTFTDQIVIMPKCLSSRNVNPHVMQPVVVLPVKATVRSGLSMSFGVATVAPQSPSQLFSGSATHVASKNLVSSQVPSSKYTSTGVEAALLSSEKIDHAAADPAVIRRHGQPIQRPNNNVHLPQGRESYFSPPPGLSSDNIVNTSEAYQKNSVRSTNGQSSANPTFSPEEFIDAAPGFPQYFGSASGGRSQYPPQHSLGINANSSQYSRNMDSGKNSLDQGGNQNNMHYGSRHGQHFSQWSGYGAPHVSQQQQHASYYPNTHYSQHVYPNDVSSPYHPPSQGYNQNHSRNCHHNPTYAAHPQSPMPYPGASMYEQHSLQTPRGTGSMMPPVSRQPFPNNYSQTKNL